jgi:two-component system sensor histidine kinase BaeS
MIAYVAAAAVLITIHMALTRNIQFAKLYATSLIFHMTFMNVFFALNLYKINTLIHVHSFTIIKIGFVIEVIIFMVLFTSRTRLIHRQYEKSLQLRQQQKIEKKLVLERAELMVELVEKKNELLANVSHELRTPLTALKLQVELLQHNLVKDVKSSYQTLDNQLSDIDCLISDIYQLAQSDIGELELKFSEFNISKILDSWTKEFKPLIVKNQLTWLYNNELPASLIIKADIEKLKQVLANLLNNSVKYTDKSGSVSLKSYYDKDSLVIIIEDSSPGVPVNKQRQIFERLYRLESSRNRATGGSGLGLAICQSLIEAHNGVIIAETSNLGGLKVTLRLPLTH